MAKKKNNFQFNVGEDGRRYGFFALFLVLGLVFVGSFSSRGLSGSLLAQKTTSSENAQFVSWTVKGVPMNNGSSMTVQPGETFPVSIVMKNTGTLYWANGTQWLESTNPNWNPNKVLPAGTVAPGTNGVFTFNVTAPNTPGGAYAFQWQMHSKNLNNGAFGQVTPSVSVNIAGPSVNPEITVIKPNYGFEGMSLGTDYVLRWTSNVPSSTSKWKVLLVKDGAPYPFGFNEWEIMTAGYVSSTAQATSTPIFVLPWTAGDGSYVSSSTTDLQVGNYKMRVCYLPPGEASDLTCDDSDEFFPILSSGNSFDLYSILNTSFANPTYPAGMIQAKIASFYLYGHSTSSPGSFANLNRITLRLDTSTPALSNLKIKLNGEQFGLTQSIATGTSRYSFSDNGSVPSGEYSVVDVYADILSSTPSFSSRIVRFDSCYGSATLSVIVNVECENVGTDYGQIVTIVRDGPDLTVALNTGLTPPSRQITMGSTNNVLGAWVLTETSNLEDVKVTDLNVLQRVLTTSTIKQGFANIGLFVGSEATPRGFANGSLTADGSGYLYKFNFSQPIIVSKSAAVTVLLKGDVASYASSGATDLSRHVFSIATTTDVSNDSVAETVVALGRTSNNAADTTLSNPKANTVQIQRAKLYASAQPIGQTSGRTKSVVDDLGMVTLTADNAGTAVLDTLRITFRGSAVNSSISPQAITLIDQDGVDVTNSFAGATKQQTCYGTTASTCILIWNFGQGGLQIGSGMSRTFKVRINSSAGTNIGNPVANLAVTIDVGGDVQYTTGIVNGLETSLDPIQTPISINSVTYASGT